MRRWNLQGNNILLQGLDTILRQDSSCCDWLLCVRVLEVTRLFMSRARGKRVLTNSLHTRSNRTNQQSTSTMRFRQLALVFATLIIAVDGNSKDPSHSVRSRRSEGAVTDHDLSTSASLYSTLAHHHGYPYGWGLPIQGLTHEVHPGMLDNG